MKLKTIILRNFRCYREEVRIAVDEDLTAFIGKNDAGKSAILEALEIFFNSDTVKMERQDASVCSGCTHVVIGCVFTDLPAELVLDATSTTTLSAEHLLNEEGDLEIHKVWDCTSKTPKERVEAICCHPTAEGAADLLELTNAQLKTRLGSRRKDATGIDQRANPELRQAIWASFDDLRLSLTKVRLDKEDAKKVWDQLQKTLPTFALFRADRPSRDEDDEVQDPMKLAVAEAIRLVEPQLEEIKERVQDEATKVARATLDKLREMDETLANVLSPRFREEPKWANLFKFTLAADDDIPLNKRGSGVRRLVLLNFFRAQAERKSREAGTPGIIYAIEEPETSQHPSNQRLLLKALIALSEREDCQVILTTHVPALAGLLPIQSLRYVDANTDGARRIQEGNDEVYDTIARELGVLPDNLVRVIVCVEGPHDVTFLRHASRILRETDASLPDLENDRRIVLVPLGGTNLQQWVEGRYLLQFRRPEVHIYDRGREPECKYQSQCDQVNARNDGSRGFITTKAEIENYLHPDAISEALGIQITVSDTSDVPLDVARALHQAAPDAGEPWDALGPDKQRKKISKAKRRLHGEAIVQMTAERFLQSDPQGEIQTWLRYIADLCDKWPRPELADT